jgi:hypothetical protein
VLKSELEVAKKSATKAREFRDVAVASLDAFSNKLTSERIVYEGSILEAKRAARQQGAQHRHRHQRAHDREPRREAGSRSRRNHGARR